MKKKKSVYKPRLEILLIQQPHSENFNSNMYEMNLPELLNFRYKLYFRNNCNWTSQKIKQNGIKELNSAYWQQEPNFKICIMIHARSEISRTSFVERIEWKDYGIVTF